MRSEHPSEGDEIAAFTGWRRFHRFRAGQRKAVKKRSHKKDRQLGRQELERQDERCDGCEYPCEGWVCYTEELSKEASGE